VARETTRPEVIVGTPICRRTAFILDKFLSNQQEIQQAYPDCSLVLATDEPDFVAELEGQIKLNHIKGGVISYETVKPDYARSRVWSIASGRETLRRYALLREAEYLLFLDSDMTYEPSVISIMKEEIQGFDVASSGYRPSRWGRWGFGGGCLMINRKTLNKIAFMCYEFKNGQVIHEDDSLDIDLFIYHARVNKGIYVSIRHYANSQEYCGIKPQPLSWFRMLANLPIIKYMLIRVSILTRYNIPRKLRALLYRKQLSSNQTRTV
jgi:hypothetical protein